MLSTNVGNMAFTSGDGPEVGIGAEMGEVTANVKLGPFRTCDSHVGVVVFIELNSRRFQNFFFFMTDAEKSK